MSVEERIYSTMKVPDLFLQEFYSNCYVYVTSANFSIHFSIWSDKLRNEPKLLKHLSDYILARWPWTSELIILGLILPPVKWEQWVGFRELGLQLILAIVVLASAVDLSKDIQSTKNQFQENNNQC